MAPFVGLPHLFPELSTHWDARALLPPPAPWPNLVRTNLFLPLACSPISASSTLRTRYKAISRATIVSLILGHFGSRPLLADLEQNLGKVGLYIEIENLFKFSSHV